MTWESTITEPRTILCPLCDKGKIRCRYKPRTKIVKDSGSVAGKRVNIPTWEPERYTVLEGCKVCGASKEEIQKILDSGEDYKKPSHDKIIERMRKAGLLKE